VCGHDFMPPDGGGVVPALPPYGWAWRNSTREEWVIAREFGPSGWYTQEGPQVGTLRLVHADRRKGVYKSTMSKIPNVQKGIEHSLLKTVKSVREGQDEGLEYLAAFWKDFKEDQPNLSKLVLAEMNRFKNQKIMAAFAHGVWMVYAALQSQEEADEMNEDWGV